MAMDVKRYMKTSVDPTVTTTLHSTNLCFLHTSEAALNNLTANLYYKPLKKLFAVLELG